MCGRSAMREVRWQHGEMTCGDSLGATPARQVVTVTQSSLAQLEACQPGLWPKSRGVQGTRAARAGAGPAHRSERVQVRDRGSGSFDPSAQDEHVCTVLDPAIGNALSAARCRNKRLASARPTGALRLET